jgi:site-specific recombinase XerD
MTGTQSTPDEDAIESSKLLSRRGIFDSYPLDADSNVANHPTPFAPTDLPLDRHPVAIYLASLSPGSRRTQRTALQIVATLVSPDATEVTLPWWALDFAHTTAIRSRLAERFAPSTSNRMLAALRGVLRAAFRLGHMTAEQMTRACAIDPVRGERVLQGRALSAGELRVLFESCAGGPAGAARNAAVLGLAYGGGLRRAELVGLDLADYDSATGALRVLGKGNKQRVVFTPAGTRHALAAWLAARGTEPGPLLLPVTKGGAVALRRMTPGAIAQVVDRLAVRAKVAAFSPHDLRRTFVGDLLDAGADIATVQAQAGHSSPTTTARYDRRGDRAKQRAAELLHVPFVHSGPDTAGG